PNFSPSGQLSPLGNQKPEGKTMKTGLVIAACFAALIVVVMLAAQSIQSQQNSFRERVSNELYKNNQPAKTAYARQQEQ
ncbi:MAG: hypothetical protein AAB467_02055, partial [Patescibacteria group bacterium]